MVCSYSTDSFISPDGLSKNLVLNRSLTSLDGNIRSVVGGFIHPGHKSIQMAEEAARRHQLPNNQRGLDRALYPFTSFPRHHPDDRPVEWHVYKPFQLQRVHLFLMAEAADLTKQKSWAQVLAVALICADGSSLYREGLASLCCHATQVFTLQPTRLYVHALYIRGWRLELWVFDRAGMYCADTFDILDNPVRYVALVLGYALMDSEALGSLNVIRVDTTRADYTRTTFVPKCKHSDSPAMAIPVSDTPFVRVMGIVGSGMVCYHAHEYSEEPNRVLKLKWRVIDDMAEEGPLQKARNCDVWGVVGLEHHGELQYTAELRKGIKFGTPLKLIVRQLGDALDRNNGGFESHTESAGKDDGIPHQDSKLHDWSRGTWRDSARKKAHFMEKSNFTYILEEFPEEHETLKPLAEDLRDILFPMEGDEIFTGTDLAAENRIYNSMIGAFEWALLQERRRAN